MKNVILAMFLVALSGCGFTLGGTRSKQTMTIQQGKKLPTVVTYESEGSMKEIHAAGSVTAVALAGTDASGRPMNQSFSGVAVGPNGQLVPMSGGGYGGYGSYGAPGFNPGFGQGGPVAMVPGSNGMVVGYPYMAPQAGPAGMIPGVGSGQGYGADSSMSVSVTNEQHPVPGTGGGSKAADSRVAKLEKRVDAMGEFLTREQCRKLDAEAAKKRAECAKYAKEGQ